MKVSIFRSVKDTIPSLDVSIYDFYENIVRGDYKAEIEEIRISTTPEIKKQLKLQLPIATISGTFSERRKSGLVQHSQRICLDIDKDQNPGIDMKNLRDQLGTVKEIEFSCLSASGQGVMAVVLLATPSQHLQHFKHLQLDFKQLGITIDPACSDVSRARFITYDPNGVFNPDVEPYRKYIPKPQPRPIPESKNISVEKLKKWLENEGHYFQKGSRHDYILRLAGACARTGIGEMETRTELERFAESGFPIEEIQNIIQYAFKNNSKQTS